MFDLFNCLAQAIAEHGVRGLIEMVPGGKFACDVAQTAWKSTTNASGGSRSLPRCNRSSLPVPERLQRVVGALRGLAEVVRQCHRLRPLVHRNLKPSNIFYEQRTSRLRITDFGIGAVMAKRELDEEKTRGQQFSRAGALLWSLRGSHTPLYASPQQRLGAEADPRDDVQRWG